MRVRVLTGTKSGGLRCTAARLTRDAPARRVEPSRLGLVVVPEALDSPDRLLHGERVRDRKPTALRCAPGPLRLSHGLMRRSPGSGADPDAARPEPPVRT